MPNTQDPERLAERLETLAKHGYVRGANSDLYESARLLRALKPSERGPTNDEIVERALCFVRSDAPSVKGRFAEAVALMALELQADTSWFKPEPEVDEATLVTREALSAWYGNSVNDRANLPEFRRARAVIAEALAKRPRVDVPSEVLEAAKWVAYELEHWPIVAERNARILTDFLLSQEPRS